MAKPEARLSSNGLDYLFSLKEETLIVMATNPIWKRKWEGSLSSIALSSGLVYNGKEFFHFAAESGESVQFSYPVEIENSTLFLEVAIKIPGKDVSKVTISLVEQEIDRGERLELVLRDVLAEVAQLRTELSHLRRSQNNIVRVTHHLVSDPINMDPGQEILSFTFDKKESGSYLLISSALSSSPTLISSAFSSSPILTYEWNYNGTQVFVWSPTMAVIENHAQTGPQQLSLTILEDPKTQHPFSARSKKSRSGSSSVDFGSTSGVVFGSTSGGFGSTSGGGFGSTSGRGFGSTSGGGFGSTSGGGFGSTSVQKPQENPKPQSVVTVTEILP